MFCYTPSGLYAESHGIVDNYMYDVKHDTEFLIGDNPEQYFSYWWNDGEPLWITASKQVKETNFDGFLAPGCSGLA